MERSPLKSLEGIQVHIPDVKPFSDGHMRMSKTSVNSFTEYSGIYII